MERRRVRILPPETAKLIAAGEVIDRPAAALRELLDNALDSGATRITADIEGGGLELIRVVDDGSGMDREDLTLSVLPHATSKIGSADDLLSLSTLGFRGEALASIAAVASVDITSAVADDQAWRLTAQPGREALVSPCKGSRGTIVSVSGLFASFPARRKFMKRPSAESAACRQVFVDKALPYPAVEFMLRSGGRPVLVLHPSGLAERVLAACAPDALPAAFRELTASGPGFSARVVAALPELYRNDRRNLQVFVNGRRVQEYGLAQALEYAYRGTLPGGAWPFAYAFVDVDPSLADFNIHPAKREVRLRNLDDIRTGLIRAIRDWLGSAVGPERGDIPAGSPSLPTDAAGLFDHGAGSRPSTVYPSSHPAATGWSAPGSFAHRFGTPSVTPGLGDAVADTVAEARASGYPSFRPASPAVPADGNSPGEPGRPFRYLGQALGTFLVFEVDDGIVLMDQHAAHERILFDELSAGRAVSQDLLVPVVYEPESEAEDAYLEAHAGELAAAGIRLVREGPSWLLEAVPAILPASRTGALFELLRKRPDPAELVREALATVACHAAVRDGDPLDDAAARAIIGRALDLPEPRCPHGRPIWTRLGRDDLFRAVRRIV